MSEHSAQVLHTPASQGDPDQSDAAGRYFGAILVDAGKLKPEQAQRILQVQKEQGLRFGEAAVKLGLLEDADIQFALSRQFDYTYLLPGDQRVSEEIVAAYQPFSPQVEALRALRSQLMLRWFGGAEERRALALVGTERGEGRSFLAANLAVVFAQLGERTLLIDADMRHPRQHLLFKLDNRTGLSSVLAGRDSADAVKPVQAFNGLSVLTAGAAPPNPQELISRGGFSAILQACAGQYEVILIDTAAMATGADAQTVAAHARGAVMVARKNLSRLRQLAAFSAALGQSGSAVIGSVLNDF